MHTLKELQNYITTNCKSKDQLQRSMAILAKERYNSILREALTKDKTQPRLKIIK